MTIKDFKPGQTAYALSPRQGRAAEYVIERYTVLSVGRKYVKATPGGIQCSRDFFLQEETDDYLIAKIDWREQAKLFLTEAAANDAIEQDMLRSWMRSIEGYKIDRYTLEQLRAVKEILEGKS